MSQTGRELTLKDKIFQKSVLSRIDILKQNNGSFKKPWVVELDPTTACNLACHDCISADLLNQGGFDRQRIKDMAKEFADYGIRAVVLIGGGEPMAHPEFGTLVDYFHENNIHVGVTSNGTLMNKYMDSLANRTKWVRISVDAGSSEVFQKYRPHRSGKSQFDSVISQMTDLGKKKKGKLGYSFLILTLPDGNGNQMTNATDIEKAGILSKEIGCDYFEVKPSFDMFHFLQNQPKHVNETINEQLDKIRHLEDENFKIISPYTLQESIEGNEVQEKSYNRCLSAELRTVVSPSGAFVCPYFRGSQNMKIGDPNTQSLKEIWNGDRRKAVINKLDPQKHCRFHCIRHSTNLALEEIYAGKKVEEVEDYDFFI